MARQISALILLGYCAGMAGAEDSVRGSLGDARFIAGGEAVLDSPVRGTAFAAGGRVEVRERVEKSAYVAGGRIDIEGAVDGDLRAYGESIEINGSVGGDVELAGANLRLGPGARISGRVVYRSNRAITVDPSAMVAGGIAKSRKEHEWLRKVRRGATIVGAFTMRAWRGIRAADGSVSG